MERIESVTKEKKKVNEMESIIKDKSANALENSGTRIESANAGKVVYCCLKCEKIITLL